MYVIALTLFVSLCLSILFIIVFLAESRLRKKRAGIEQEALLPLDDGAEPAAGSRADQPNKK